MKDSVRLTYLDNARGILSARSNDPEPEEIIDLLSTHHALLRSQAKVYALTCDPDGNLRGENT